eukprot:scaffold63814_cov20-Tisochrysis_lutea.AAC.1
MDVVQVLIEHDFLVFHEVELTRVDTYRLAGAHAKVELASSVQTFPGTCLRYQASRKTLPQTQLRMLSIKEDLSVPGLGSGRQTLRAILAPSIKEDLNLAHGVNLLWGDLALDLARDVKHQGGRCPRPDLRDILSDQPGYRAKGHLVIPCNPRPWTWLETSTATATPEGAFVLHKRPGTFCCQLKLESQSAQSPVPSIVINEAMFSGGLPICVWKSSRGYACAPSVCPFWFCMPASRSCPLVPAQCT